MSLCNSIESAKQWFQIHHGITFVTIHNPAVYLSGARVSTSHTLVPRLLFFVLMPAIAFSGGRCASIAESCPSVFFQTFGTEGDTYRHTHGHPAIWLLETKLCNYLLTKSVLILSTKVCFKVNYLTRHSFWCKNRWENKKVMGNLM